MTAADAHDRGAATVQSFAVAVPGGCLAGERRNGGDGRPLILAHGFGGSCRDWDAVAEHLDPALDLVRYDQRGFGESAAEPGVPFSHAADLIALLDALGIEQADVCGLSMGGATLLGAALQAPQRIGRLVLVSPLLADWSWTPEWVERWKAVGRAARAGDLDQARRLWWEHPLFATVRDGPHGGSLKQAIDAFAGRQWVQDDQREEGRVTERLHEIAIPTLLLTGGMDLPDFRSMADMIAGALPHVQRIDDPSAGHMLTLERSAQVAAAITAFLAR